jgi:hypothetical protein
MKNRIAARRESEEHQDIFNDMEIIIAKCAAAKPLALRYRYYQLIRSYTSKQDRLVG